VRYLYAGLAYLLVPLYASWMLARGIRDRAWRARFAERFGFGAPVAGDAAIWVHAVSVGEVQSSTALLHALRERFPRRPLVLTTVTPSGAARARALFGNGVTVRYLPYDLPGSVRRFLARVRPALAIVLETEIWPNLFQACARRSTPVVLVSARLSERSVRRYRRLGGLIRGVLAEGVVVAAQTPVDAERFLAIGAAPARTSVAGSLKFDLSLPADIAARGATLRREQAASRPLWVAGSTHPGEETLLLAAHRRLREWLPDALLVLAPRHADRFAEVAAGLAREGVQSVRRSSGLRVATDTEVLLLDTLGELPAFYAAGDVAFVAGSLVPIGGHNLLEPAALGRPILAGPHNFNAPDVARLLIAAGAARIVADPEELAAALRAWLTDAAERERVGALGQAVVEGNRGALGRVLAILEPLLRGAATGPTAGPPPGTPQGPPPGERTAPPATWSPSSGRASR
jgi:3-deoxy-D-manno-octulosonic-acid transferase